MGRLIVWMVLPLLILLPACAGAADGSPSPPAAPASPTSPGGGPRLGLAVSLTGPDAALGQEQQGAAQLAVSYFNAQADHSGPPVTLVVQDSDTGDQGAIQAFQALIAQPVVGIIGPTTSQQAFSADPFADQAKVPVLGASNTAKGIPQIGDYIARVSAPATVVAPPVVTAALRLNPRIKQVAVFYDADDAYAVSETGTFQDAVKAHGLGLGPIQTFHTTDTAFQAPAAAAVQRAPDLVIISARPAAGGNLIQQLRALGYTGLIIGGNGLNTESLFPVCGSHCDGLLLGEAYNPAAPGPINTAFRAAYQAQYQQDPTQRAALGSRRSGLAR